MQTIRESDWKILRELKTVALERFCQRALDAVQKTMAEPGASAHEKYLQVYRLIEARDQELSELFDDLKRSNAFFRIEKLRQADLISDAGYSGFSEELQALLALLRSR
jgi:hypothetical protein